MVVGDLGNLLLGGELLIGQALCVLYKSVLVGRTLFMFAQTNQSLPATVWSMP